MLVNLIRKPENKVYYVGVEKLSSWEANWVNNICLIRRAIINKQENQYLANQQWWARVSFFGKNHYTLLINVTNKSTCRNGILSWKMMLLVWVKYLGVRIFDSVPPRQYNQILEPFFLYKWGTQRHKKVNTLIQTQHDHSEKELCKWKSRTLGIKTLYWVGQPLNCATRWPLVGRVILSAGDFEIKNITEIYLCGPLHICIWTSGLLGSNMRQLTSQTS